MQHPSRRGYLPACMRAPVSSCVRSDGACGCLDGLWGQVRSVGSSCCDRPSPSRPAPPRPRPRAEPNCGGGLPCRRRQHQVRPQHAACRRRLPCAGRVAGVLHIIMIHVSLHLPAYPGRVAFGPTAHGRCPARMPPPPSPPPPRSPRSVTKGIVSRIALVRYSATARLLSIQIDAAINPGQVGGVCAPPPSWRCACHWLFI